MPFTKGNLTIQKVHPFIPVSMVYASIASGNNPTFGRAGPPHSVYRINDTLETIKSSKNIVFSGKKGTTVRSKIGIIGTDFFL